MARHIYFDLDGTLTDPFVGISRSIEYALERLGVPRPTDDELRRFIGPPLLESFAELVGSDARYALELYRERFGDVGWQENEPYEGIHETLASLKEQAVLFVATSKPRVYAERIVEYFGMSPCFDTVYGAELDGTRGDKTELLAYALDLSPGHSAAVMIGDRRHDMIGARNNNMNAIGAAWGYGSIEELESAGAQSIAHAPTELKGLVTLS
ncbi:MAG: HAD hydrolase-like protein [Woeseiaceae bacterium]|nr:HAD hydrolase-like protein [Woeseiaceae bacterium]